MVEYTFDPTCNNAMALAMRAGNEDALHCFIHLNRQWIYNKALRILENPEDAAEATNACFFHIWDKAVHNWEPARRPFVLYLGMFVRCSILKHRKALQAKKRLPFEDGNEMIQRLHNESLEPLRAIVKDETLQRINTVIEASLLELTPKRRTTFILKHVEGYSLKEVARILNTTRNNVVFTLYKTKCILKELLWEHAAGDEILMPIVYGLLHLDAATHDVKSDSAH